MHSEIDTLHRVETPENIDLQAECAGPISRGLAYLVDLAIRSAAMLALTIVPMLAGRTGTGLLMLGWFLLDWFYPVVFEVLRNGQTPGKRVMGLRTVHEDLSPIGWNASLVRNLLRFVDFLPIAYLLGLASMCLTTRFQRLGDLAAGTLVVYAPEPPAGVPLPRVPPQSPPLALDQGERVALVSYARRDGTLSDSRKLELARLLDPVVPGLPDPVRYWQGVGIGLLGES